MAVITTYGLVGIDYQRPAIDWSPEIDEMSFSPFPPRQMYEMGATGYVAVTSNLPISELENTVTSYLARSFLDDYYYRVHVQPGVIALGNLLSVQTRNVEVWNAHFDGKLLSSISDTGLDGIDITEPVAAPTTFASLESRIYTLSVSINGSPTIDGQYDFHFSGETPTLRITGRRVVVWPFVPQTKFREQLQWLTDVMQAYSAEQRLALRTAPRQSFQYDFQLNPRQYSRAKAISTQWAHRVYGAPVWSDAVRLGNLSAGATSLSFDTTDADFRADDVVLVWESDEKFSAVETTTKTDSSLDLKLPLDQPFNNAYVMPLRFARTLRGTEFRRGAHDIVDAKMVFLVGNNIDLGESIGLPQYRGVDVMTDRSVVVSDMAERIVRAVDVFDNGSGPIEVDQERAYPDRSEVLTMDALTRAEAWRMRQWLHARRGRQKSFWLPGWNSDIEIIEDVGAAASAITVKPIGYPLYYGVSDIMIDLSDGSRLYGRILSGATDGSGNEILALEAPFGVAFAFADVVMCCFMKHVRLDTDQIDVTHSYAGRATASMSVIETPEGA